jgi:hypothetical protein
MQEAFAATLAPAKACPGIRARGLYRRDGTWRLTCWRRALQEAKREELARRLALAQQVADTPEETMLKDARLRLIFTCCHPALAREAQVPLTLRTLCGRHGCRARAAGAPSTGSLVFLALFRRRHQRGAVDAGNLMGDGIGPTGFEVGQHHDRKLVINVAGDVGIESLP